MTNIRYVFLYIFLMAHHVPCDFVDGEDASIALQSLVVALSFPLHCWLGASALHPAVDRDEEANDHED